MQDSRSRSGTVIYVVSEELVKASSQLPSNKNRSFLVHSLVGALGLLSSATPDGNRCFTVLRPRRASTKDLLAYHTRDYLEYALDPSSDHEDQTQTTEFGLEDDCPPFRNMHEYIQLVGGATLTAVDAIKEDASDAAICWDGGRHHAQKAKASGFCYVADCILAILSLKRAVPSTVPARKPRVMYLDLDLHFSDAVSQAFHNATSSTASQVLTFSIHHTSPGFFPASPLSALPDPDDPGFDPYTLSLPLKVGASNRTFARIWPIVDGVRDIFDPDFVIIQCGVDGLAGDPMATWNWSLDGPGSLGWYVKQIMDDWPGKKLFLGGGGYNSPNAARAWAYLASVVGGNPLSMDTQIPDHRAFPLYQPSFTLDVPAGYMQDHNSEDYLQLIENRYERVRTILRHRASN